MVKHPELFDEELLECKSRGLLPLDKAWFHSSVTSQDSQALNSVGATASFWPAPACAMEGAFSITSVLGCRTRTRMCS